MLKKLRNKLIFTNMLLVTLVLVVVFSTILVINYQQNEQEVEDALQAAVTMGNGGMVIGGAKGDNSNFSTTAPSDEGSTTADGSAAGTGDMQEGSQTDPGQGQQTGSSTQDSASGNANPQAAPTTTQGSTSTDAGNSGSSNTPSGQPATSTSSQPSSQDGQTTQTAALSTQSLEQIQTTAVLQGVADAYASEQTQSTSQASDTTTATTSTATTTDPGVTPPQMHGDGNRSLVQVAVYSLKDDGTLEIVSNNSVSISETVLEAAASDVTYADDGFGKLSDVGLYYYKQTNPDGTKVAFADTSNVTTPMTKLLSTLLAVGGIALVAFFFISLFLAKWALRPVEHAWTQQHQFVADASHELKTPLTVILANNSILLEHPDKTIGSQLKWVRNTEDEALQMQDLINDLLFLAKPESEEIKRLYSEVNMSELVDRNLLQFESVAFEREIDMQSDVEEGISLAASENRLQRLVSTLIDNACKYAASPGHVEVTLRREGKDAVFTVKNDGNPIAEEDLEHIFDRFYRGDKSRDRKTTGYGLGLAIAKEVCDEMGGTLTADSGEGKLTTFSASLPMTQK